MSSVMTPAYAAAYRALEQAAVPRATGAINVLNRVGGSAGIALLAVVLAATPGPGGFGSAYWLLFALTAAALIPAAFLPRSGTRLPPAWPGRTAPAIDGTPGRG